MTDALRSVSTLIRAAYQRLRGRPAREAWRSIRAFAGEVRRRGVRSAVARVRAVTTPDDPPPVYARWVARHSPTAKDLARMSVDQADLPYRPRLSIITPCYNTEARWLRPFFESVRRQVYPNWELCIGDDASTDEDTRSTLGAYAAEYANDPRLKITRLPVNRGISAASNAALALATGDFVVMMDSDDELPPDALYEVARYLNEHSDADFIYSDEDKLDLDGHRCEPYFKPDWSPELFLSYMYTNHLMVVRRSLVEEIGGFKDEYTGSQDYDLVLQVVSRTSHIHHIPKVLYHWRKIPGSAAAEAGAKPYPEQAGRRAIEHYLCRRGVDAEVLSGPVSGLYRVRHRILGQPLLSIIIPTADRRGQIGERSVSLVQHAVRCILEKTDYRHYEILVADDGQLSDATRKFLAGVPHRRVASPRGGQFNFSRTMNAAVSQARGDHLVFFNEDLEVIAPEWLGAMLEYSQQPEIGAVGAKLLFPDGRLQHIGIVTGVCGIAAHGYQGHPGASSGYAGSAIVARNYSAVSGACMMTRRDVFDEAGGLDERFPADFNDVDYCLRLRRAGYRIVYTPYAQLYHLESGSLGWRVRTSSETHLMKQLWGEVVERDPYYNPNLSKDFADYRLQS